MRGKDDVVELDGRLESLVAGGILGTDQRGVEKGKVGDEISEEASRFRLSLVTSKM